MPRFGFREWIFSSNCFIAAMLALFVSFSLGLERPFWAMTTVYITSQPLSGAVRSKAVFRLIGTAVGGAATIAMVPCSPMRRRCYRSRSPCGWPVASSSRCWIAPRARTCSCWPAIPPR